MPRFVLLDHSLKGVGGHHFDYALHALRAAEELNYEPVLVCNKRFRGHSKLPRACRVLPYFRYHTYSKYTIFAGTRMRLFEPAAEDSAPAPTLWARLQNVRRRAGDWLYHLRHKNGPERRIRDFSGACRRAFGKLGIQPADVAFIPTLSELDLAGLAAFLESEPATQEIDWHLQFHFNIFDGREPDYPQQAERLTRLRAHFEQTLARVPNHRLHFYNTSDILTRQYNRLGVARFEELPYPINEAFHARRQEWRPSARPLRITCAGGVRAEKGQHGLGELVRQLWADCLEAGRAQLLVQAKPARFSGRPKFFVPLPDATREPPRKTCLPHEECSEPIVYVRHPLGIDDYEELIRRADIGLLLYDSLRYYSRRAGVLGELLAAGIPVVAPAGCWLGEQIAEANFRHVERMLAQLRSVQRISGFDLSWIGLTIGPPDSAHARRLIVPGDSPATALCLVPAESTELALVPRWAAASEPGAYLRVQVAWFDSAGEPLSQCTHLVGRREANLPVPLLTRREPAAQTMRLALSNAYGRDELELSQCDVRFLSSRGAYPNGCPLGAVGLAAAEAGEAPRLLREIIAHYEHYRKSAGEFSVGWFARHDPRLTVQTLLDKSPAAKRRAAA